MKDEESQVVIGQGLFGKGKYKFWVIAAILLLAFWSVFTGSLSLSLNRLSHSSDSPVHDDLDVLEVEEREKLVRQMWDVYTQSKSTRLPKFWQEAFEAAYEDMTSDSAAARTAAVSEIAKMSIRRSITAASHESISNQRETEEEKGQITNPVKEKQ